MSRTHFRNARLLDGLRPAVPATTVVVEGERIVAVAPDADAEAPGPEDVVLDVGGRTLMPGMVTCHFHSAARDVVTVNDFELKHPAPYLALVAADNLRIALDSGVTSVVGAGVIHNIDVELKRAMAAGLLLGPRMVTSGGDLCPTGGPVDMRPIHWGPPAATLTRICDGADEFRKAAREEVKAGVEMIKLLVTGGHGGFNTWAEALVVTREELSAAIDATHALGARARGHVATRDGIMAALDAGLDVIDHGDGIDADCAARMVDTGTPLVPTIHLLAANIAKLRANGSDPERLARLERDLEVACRGVALAQEAGVVVGLGDDYGLGPIRHGDYSRELALLVEHVGVSPLEAITMATRNGAIVFGRDDLGTVEVGKLADLLVVDGDPSADVRVLEDAGNIRAVVLDGRIVRGDLPLAVRASA